MNTQVAEKLGLLLRNKSDTTRRVYLIEIGKFLDEVGLKENYTEWDLHRFFQKMEKKGYSASYRQNTLFALRLLWRAMDKEFPLTTRDFAKVPGETESPIMLFKEVQVLISSTRAKGGGEEKAYLALSTTYGMRVGEMAKIKGADVDKVKGRILVRTEKGGRERWHLLPEEIIPYVLTYPFRERKEASLNLLFRKICSLAGLKKRKRQAWHSIRHCLVSALRVRMPGKDPLIANFMRWKNTSGITGLGQRNWERQLDIYTDLEDEAVDREIFKSHPFLKFWAIKEV